MKQDKNKTRFTAGCMIVKKKPQPKPTKKGK